MLHDPRAPFVFGVVMVLALGGYLALYHPNPGELARAHDQIPGLAELSGCESCHSGIGLTGGCLSCHTEIKAQLDARRGYHHHLSSEKEVHCSTCHLEHLGAAFELIDGHSWSQDSADQFPHPHVEFTLSGAHDELDCAGCHQEKLSSAFTLPGFASLPRESTYLGLDQECVTCHEDVHTGGLSTMCEDCHGQETFRPAVHFDHDSFFVLEGAHVEIDCDGCHVFAEDRAESDVVQLPFDEVRGTSCAECHASPHRAPFGETCEDCHPGKDPSWDTAALSLTPELHANTSFVLSRPHDQVECSQCHLPEGSYDERFSDPSALSYRRQQDSCQGCHEDAHRGQFIPKYERCLDCHERVRFVPASFGLARHADVYPLTGAHAGVPCISCHQPTVPEGPRRFAGTSATCKDCHADPHGNQFEKELTDGDCTSCHTADATNFALADFDHATDTGYTLSGAHAAARCDDCHRETTIEQGDGLARFRVFRDTSTRCSSCHKDVHHGQFSEASETTASETQCERCHENTKNWTELQFDHDTQSRFPLDRAHRELPCDSCHFTVTLEGGTKLRQFRPLGRECEDCHEIEEN